jgi:DNA polymerase-1
MPPTLFLIDGHALAYRTYFALTRAGGENWITRSGEPTAGVYGFASVLLRILDQEKPDYLMVAFDTGKTFRDELYQNYKGTREKMPAELAVQLKRIRQLVDAFNIPRLEIEGYEADDVLGSVAQRAVDAGLGVKIITGDRDLLQLVSDRIIVNLPGKSLSDARDYFVTDVVEVFGVRPDQIVDYKSLVGDKSDNIPGVAGIGEKTAVGLLSEFGSLENIYNHLDQIKGSVQKKLEAGRDAAFLSQKLARIVVDLTIPLNLDIARTGDIDLEKVESIFRELEFRSLLTRLTSLIGGKEIQLPVKETQLSMFAEPVNIRVERSSLDSLEIHVVDSLPALSELITKLEQADLVSFDTETTSTDQMEADLVGISLAIEPGAGYYIPVGHRNGTSSQLPISTVLDGLLPPLKSTDLKKVGHNLKYDFVMLRRYGLPVSHLYFDTMIAEWLVNPSSRNLGLKNLAWVRLDVRMTNIEELIGKGKLQRSMADVPISDAAAYAIADAVIPLQLMASLQKELSDCKATRLFEEVEMPLIPVLADMEMSGISLDVEFLNNMSTEMDEKLKDIEARIFEEAGGRFNINSPQQLSEALFGRLGLSPPGRTQKTSSGFYSTAADTLEAMRGEHRVVDWVLEYRELSKLKSTYIDALPIQVNPTTKRVHTSYNQAGSVTGRIASSEPNLQNIPIRTELGRQIRKAFITEPGYYLLSVDYSQVELRILAHMANDLAMLEAFQAGQDIHSATAAAIFGIPINQVTQSQRSRAKGINFGLMYGMSPYGLARYTDLTLAEAENFSIAYFQQFPGVKRFLDNLRHQAANQGYVETLLGRRRYFPGLKTQSNQSIRNREEREAINAPIQGTAADILKLSMIQVPKALKEAGLSARLLLQVHDELVLECPQDELVETATAIRNVMESAYTLNAPLATEARYGPNWYDVQSV